MEVERMERKQWKMNLKQIEKKKKKKKEKRLCSALGFQSLESFETNN